MNPADEKFLRSLADREGSRDRLDLPKQMKAYFSAFQRLLKMGAVPTDWTGNSAFLSTLESDARAVYESLGVSLSLFCFSPAYASRYRDWHVFIVELAHASLSPPPHPLRCLNISAEPPQLMEAPRLITTPVTVSTSTTWMLWRYPIGGFLGLCLHVVALPPSLRVPQLSVIPPSLLTLTPSCCAERQRRLWAA
jgi:hypothetical protein